MANAKDILLQEMAVDTGGNPDWIDQGTKRKIEQGQHPWAGNQAFPTDADFTEKLASENYQKLMQKLKKYNGGRLPRNKQEAMMAGYQLYMKVIDWESEHKEVLENKAVDIVLDLPEFKAAKAAYDAGDLRIEAKLVEEVSTEGIQTDEEVAEREEQQQQEEPIADEIKAELDEEKRKRQVVNLLTQGASVNKNYAFHLAGDVLNEINPQLANSYGLLMTIGVLSQWAVPDEAFAAAAGGEGPAGTAGGKARYRLDDDGVFVIMAEAMCMPILIQEIVKGMMMFLSYDEDTPADTATSVEKSTDTLQGERWDITHGAAAWEKFMAAIGEENQEYMPYVYHDLIKRPVSEFNKIMSGVLKGSPEAKQEISKIIAAHKGEQEEPARIEYNPDDNEPESYGGPDEPEDKGPDKPKGKGSDDWMLQDSVRYVLKKLLD